MSIKDKTIETCTELWKVSQSTVKSAANYVAKKSTEILKDDRVQEGVVKIKHFYEGNKEVCIFGATVATLWIITRLTRKSPPPSQEELTESKQESHQSDKQKEKKKKHPVTIPATNKIFMDEQGVQFFPDEPSTDIVRRQVPKKKVKAYESESEQDEKNDKIFFQMYNAYGNSEES